jgi:hypothetical protein
MFKLQISILSAVLLLSFASCKKSAISDPIATKGSFTIEFDHVVNGSPLVFNTQAYTNAHGDQFTLSTFKYYVSNIKLTKTDGSIYQVPESYLLVDAAKPETFFNKIGEIPTGDYTAISFLIGVDEARNLAGAQTGALDPTNGMFWTWNSGYIFVKLEGNSPQSTAKDKSLTFHVGGIVAPNNTVRTTKTTFTEANPLRIRTDKNPQLHFKVDAASLFTGKQEIDFAKLNFTMGGADATIIADNYVNGLFKLDHIHN